MHNYVDLFEIKTVLNSTSYALMRPQSGNLECFTRLSVSFYVFLLNMLTCRVFKGCGKNSSVFVERETSD